MSTLVLQFLLIEVGCGSSEGRPPGELDVVSSTPVKADSGVAEASMKIQYLEIVTTDVDGLCATYRDLYGVQFGEPDMSLGNARTAELSGGGLLGIRAPLRPDEEPIVRPYFLVQDIEASVAIAKESDADIAIPPMELPGHGRFSIFLKGGVDHGLWKQHALSPE